MRGTYTIILDNKFDGYRIFGKLGKARLGKGRYLYTGSALGSGSTSLERRLERHAARSKKVRWHIDYLTSQPSCKVSGAVYLVSKERLECDVNESISKELGLTPVLPRIGASDCNCAGHILGPEPRLSRRTLTKQLMGIYWQLASRYPSSRYFAQIDCASSHLFWNASRKILIRP
jgi:Uri superfamily endonuclease